MKTITILLVEDHLIVREGLRALLDQQTDLEVIGESDNGRQAVAMFNDLRPDVVVMDIAMPMLNGLEATKQILKISPTAKVIILSAHSDDAYVENAVAIGAAGFIIKQTVVHVLIEAIRKVYNGKRVFSSSIADRLTYHKKKAKAAGDLTGKKPSPLTSRESEVLQLIAEGNANKVIADELNISIKTVEKHRQSLMEKLNIHDTAGLTRYAISKGIIESSIQVTIL
jgi:DNA-binding NarL/FixJ family response regulator